VAPKLSDEKGRLMILRTSLVLQIIAQAGIYATRSLTFCYVMMVILGTTHSAKNIVVLNHILEMVPADADKNQRGILAQGLTPIKFLIN